MNLESPDPSAASRPAPPGQEFDRHLTAITEAGDTLDALDRVPVEEHASRFEGLHDALTAALSAIESV
jgi:primosomal protein N''